MKKWSEKTSQSDFYETWWKGVARAKEEPIQFWSRFASGITFAKVVRCGFRSPRKSVLNNARHLNIPSSRWMEVQLWQNITNIEKLWLCCKHMVAVHTVSYYLLQMFALSMCHSNLSKFPSFGLISIGFLLLDQTVTLSFCSVKLCETVPHLSSAGQHYYTVYIRPRAVIIFLHSKYFIPMLCSWVMEKQFLWNANFCGYAKGGLQQKYSELASQKAHMVLLRRCVLDE